MTTKQLNTYPQDVQVVAENNRTTIYYSGMSDGIRRFCLYSFKGLYEFHLLSGREITLKEIV